MKKIILILGGLLLLAVVALTFLADSNWVKETLAKEVGKAVKGNCTIDDLSLSFWSGKASVKGLHLEKEENGDTVKLDTNEASVDLALLPLLSKEIRVEEVHIVHPSIEVQKQRKRDFRNLSTQDMIELIKEVLTKKEEPKPTSEKPAFAVHIDKLKITDGTLKFVLVGKNQAPFTAGLSKVNHSNQDINLNEDLHLWKTALLGSEVQVQQSSGKFEKTGPAASELSGLSVAAIERLLGFESSYFQSGDFALKQTPEGFSLVCTNLITHPGQDKVFGVKREYVEKILDNRKRTLTAAVPLDGNGQFDVVDTSLALWAGVWSGLGELVENIDVEALIKAEAGSAAEGELDKLREKHKDEIDQVEKDLEEAGIKVPDWLKKKKK